MSNATYRKGHPNNPLTNEEVKKKFNLASAATLKQERMNQIIEIIKSLENISDMTKLVELLY